MGSVEEISEYPVGITKSFLEEVLESPIESFNVKTGSAPGDNFMSVLHSIYVCFKGFREPMHLLIKVYPNHPTRQKFLDSTNCFHKELLVYKDYVSELTTLPKKIGIITPEEGTLTLAFPPLIHGEAVDYTKSELNMEVENGGGREDIGMKNYLLMVDMRKTWGFQMANKFKGLDYQHVKLVVQELAKFHALGWAYKVKNALPKLLDKFPYLVESVFCDKQKDVLSQMILGNVKLVEDIFEKTLGHDSPVLKSFLKMENDATGNMLKFVNGREQELEYLLRILPDKTENSEEMDMECWAVGLHGDCWSNNMLFRYDEKTKEPLEIVFVDLQLARESCPTMDLSYFFYSSTEADFRRKHLDEMLSIYHSNFLYFCKVLECQPLAGFTVENLRRRFHRRKLFGYICSLLLLPLILQTPGKHDMDKIEISADVSLPDMLANFQRDQFEMDTISERLLALTHEMYEQGII